MSGLLSWSLHTWCFYSGTTLTKSAAIAGLIEAREQAKKDKDYALADQIRADLKLQGIVLEDSRTGTRWRRA